MRIFTLLFAGLFAFTVASGQAVLVNSPAGLAGPYNFSAANFGADLTTGIWTGDAVYVDDGSANPTQGCNALINGADVAGKIALINRGSCEFGQKCLNAENEGAIAAIVFNNAAGAGTIVMGAGAMGGSVTIPCVMLSYEDGQLISAAITNGETVNISLGAIKFDNDLSTDDRSGVFRPPFGTFPANQADAGFIVPVGAQVTNVGLNVASNVTVAATITKDGNEVYNESASEASLDPDSSVVIGLPDYDATGESVGQFVMDYTISSDSVDQLDNDNAASTSFYFSNNVYSKAGWDTANNRPARTNAYTISGGGNIEFLSGFSIPNGQGMILDSIQFYVAVGTGLTLSDVQGSVGAFMYEWTDANSDGGVGTDELALVAITDVTFSDPAATNEWVKVPVLDFNTFEEGLAVSGDGATYFVGVRYEGADLVFFGFDENFDQTLWSSFIAQSDLELPYIGVQGWVNNIPDVDNGFIFTGFFGSSATAVVVNSPNSAKDVEIVSNLSMFPNPASERLTVEVELPALTSTLEYKIQSTGGQMVRYQKRSNVNYDKAEFDVTDLPSGQYFLILKTDNGSSARAFTVQH